MTITGVRGELREGVLPAVLRALYVGRRSGMLHLARGAEKAKACFIQGGIVFGETNIAECHLGAILVRHGLLDQGDVDGALEMQAISGKRLGQVLVDADLLDADGLEDALALQVREVLLAVFTWREGTYEFEEQAPEAFRGYDRPLRLSMGEVILDAAWSITDPEVIRYGLGDLDRVLAPATDPLLRFQKVHLTPVDGFLLSRIDGTLSAREVLEVAPVGREEAERSLFGLVYTGMVDFAPDARRPAADGRAFRQQVLDTYASLARKTHHEVLGVGPDASRAEVHAAWVRQARLFHPDRRHEPGLQDLHDALAAIFARINEANRALTGFPPPKPAAPAPASPAPSASSPPFRPAPPPAPAAPRSVPDEEADAALDQAQAALAASRPWEAIGHVERILAGLSGRRRRRARVLRAEACLRGPEGRRLAEEELKKALAEDAGNAEAFLMLGRIYQEGGAVSLAAAQFRKVLALQPRHEQALAALEALAPREPGATPNLLRRLLKR